MSTYLTFIFFAMVAVAFMVIAAYKKPQWLYLTLSVIMFAVFFAVWNGYWLQYLLFMLGILLLIVEFYIPGFGIAGVLGLLGTIAGLYWYTESFIDVLVVYIAAITTIALITYMFAKFNVKIQLTQRFILNTALNQPSGYSANPDLSYLEKETGVTLTDLRPVGRAQFGENIFDVISDMDMIARDQVIRVHRVEGAKIYVRKETD